MADNTEFTKALLNLVQALAEEAGNKKIARAAMQAHKKIKNDL